MQSKHGNYYGVLVAIFALTSLTLISCSGDKPSQAKEPAQTTEATVTTDGKVAVVNGTEITKAQLDRELERITQQFTHSGMKLDDAKMTELKKNVLDNLIATELLYQKSQKEGFSVEETALNEQFEMVKKQFPDEAKFQEELTKLNFSADELKAQIRKGMTIQQLIKKEVVDKIVISDQETADYYKNNPKEFTQSEQIKASHILIKVDPDADDATKAKSRKEIEAVKTKIKKGQDFAALAKEFSQGPSASKGGDLGFFGREQMVKPFAEAAFNLKPNEVSDVVETKFGYHLIKVFDKKSGRTIPYDAIKTSLQKNLQQQKARAATSEYINKLKTEGKVEEFPLS